MGLQWDLMVVMCTFPVTKDVEHLVIGFPATRILLVKCLTKSFAHYLLMGGLSLYYWAVGGSKQYILQGLRSPQWVMHCEYLSCWCLSLDSLMLILLQFKLCLYIILIHMLCWWCRFLWTPLAFAFMSKHTLKYVWGAVLGKGGVWWRPSLCFEDSCRLTDGRREPQGSSVTSQDSGLGEESLEPVWVNMMASWRSWHLGWALRTEWGEAGNR